MNIAIGVDHRGFALKEYIVNNMTYKEPITWIDVGTYSEKRTDYPLYTVPVCEKILTGEADFGILSCGTGVGMSVAANRFEGIYAALVWNKEIAKKSKEDDNSNILILPADFITSEEAIEMINSWLNAKFKGGRYQDRLTMIDEI